MSRGDPFSEQQQNLERVRAAIARIAFEFCQERWQSGDRTFHLRDVNDFILSRIDGDRAPDSPRRILSDLQNRGKVHYDCTYRARSLYMLLWVQQPGEELRPRYKTPSSLRLRYYGIETGTLRCHGPFDGPAELQEALARVGPYLPVLVESNFSMIAGDEVLVPIGTADWD